MSESGRVRSFRKRPVVIEAVQFDGSNALDIVRWMGARYVSTGINGDRLVIVTLEGDMTASVGDWIIKGVQGEFYPCKPDIFEATYETAPASGSPDVRPWDEHGEAVLRAVDAARVTDDLDYTGLFDDDDTDARNDERDTARSPYVPEARR